MAADAMDSVEKLLAAMDSRNSTAIRNAARDRDSDEMMYWQRAYLDTRCLLKVGFDFDAYFENR